MGGGGDGGSKIGGGVELTDAVLTCEGHISDPQLPSKLSHLASCLQTITDSDKWLVRKVEPWNSVKVTFSIPKEAAERLHLLAQAGDTALRQLGILSVQVEGDQIVSLKVNGPNNEPAEILLRADNPSSSSSEMLAPTAIPRQASHSFVVPSLVGGQGGGHKVQPIPQFRSPGQGTDGGTVGPRKMGSHARPPQPAPQGFSFVDAAAIGPQQRPAMQQQPAPRPPLPPQGILPPPPAPALQGVPVQRVLSTTITRPTFPSNPPPPYPGQDAGREATNVHAVVQANLHKAGPSQVVATQLLTPHASSPVSSYRAPAGHAAQPTNAAQVANNAIMQTARSAGRAPVNMVKNSPLLVGLLQSPEQTPAVVKSAKISSLPVPHNISRVSAEAGGPSSPALTNVAVVPSAGTSGLPINRSREGTPTLQQIFPGGAATVPNSLPAHGVPLAVVSKPSPQVLGNGQMQLSAPPTVPQHGTDTRVAAADSIRYLPASGSGQQQQEQLPSGGRGGPPNSIKPEAAAPIVTSSAHKKGDSQYLINPNTGLLEPRPSTDSSDSEAEGKSPHTNNSAPSDDESSSNGSSRKDGGAGRTKIMPSHKEKLPERDITAASWHNSLVNSEDKIKLKFKLGRETCGAQTTIVASKRRGDTAASCPSAGLGGTSEPRIPKLHIKLNNCQPVIVKSMEEASVSGSLDAKGAKFRKKLSRSKVREDELKFKPGGGKRKGGTADISARFVRLSDTKRLRDTSDLDLDAEGVTVKAPKLCDDSKITISKASRADKARKPRKPARKISGLANNLGGEQQKIASHKIMETLPPAIIKVADMHAQQQSSLTPTIAALFGSAQGPRDPLACDVTLEPKEKEVGSSLLETSGKSGSSSFLSNGDVCGGATISKTLLNSAETSTYRDSPEGLGSVKKFLNSSVLINKMGSAKPPYNNCINNYRIVEEPDVVRAEVRPAKPEPIFKKLEGYKSCDFPLIRTSSDVTIQSVSKSDLLNLGGKMEVAKPKIESSKVGRVLCVDVMDRKALEEALKSSRDSVKKAESSPRDPATSMVVDRLRRWNSIDNSSPVPFSSLQAAAAASDSTNIPSAAVKGEANNCPADGDSGRRSVCENNSTETTNCPPTTGQVANVVVDGGVNSKSDCDNSCAVNDNFPVGDFSQYPPAEGCASSSLVGCVEGHISDKKEYLVDAKISDVPPPSKSDGPVVERTRTPDCGPMKSDSKVAELLATKVDVDSPEGTPKGDHGNGQGGEDSGIESMDALSEKSPNHSDQSPHRREDKECDLYSMKCKDACDSAQPKEQQACVAKENPPAADETIECDPPPPPELDCHPAKEESSATTELPKPDTKPTAPPSPDEVPDKVANTTDSSTPSAVASHNTPAIKTDSYITNSEASDARRVSPVKPLNALNCSSDTEPLIPPPGASCPNEARKSLDGCGGDTPISLTTTTIANSSIILQKFLTSSAASGPATTSTQSSIAGGSSGGTSIAKASLLAITLTRPPGGAKINSQYAASIAMGLDQQSSDAQKPPSTTNSSPPCSIVGDKSRGENCASDSISTSASITIPTPITISTVVANTCIPIVKTSTLVSNLSTATASTSPVATTNTSITTNSAPVATSSTPIAAISVPLPTSCSPIVTNIPVTIITPNATITPIPTITPNATITPIAPITTNATITPITTIAPIATTSPPLSINNALLATNSVPLLTTCTAVPAASSAPPPTMILLAASASTINPKMASVRPSSATTNPPIAKAFRLVALPAALNSAAAAPVSNPVRGQIVTLKPIVTTPASAVTLEMQPVPPPTQPVKLDTILNHVSSESEDLDFVGFSSARRAEETSKEARSMCHDDDSSPPNLLSPTQQEDPTPIRVRPPLYTYGNKERKKDVECEADDKDHDLKPLDDDELELEDESESSSSGNKLTDVVLDALTIEIPPVEGALADDKRLIRTTRQSARLSSPKVNSAAAGDLSPHPDKKVIGAAVVSVAKQHTPARSSVSPALRGGGVKRKRHESESSNASSVSEDPQDGTVKSRRRKTTTRDELLKGRATRFKEAVEEKDKVETSDEECQSELLPTVILTSLEDGLSSSKSGPAKDKDAINLRDNVRRASRQKSQPEKEEPGDGAETAKAPPPKSTVKVATSVKTKKENVDQSESSEAGRRKTRSTAGNASEDVPSKRRRQSKEK